MTDKTLPPLPAMHFSGVDSIVQIEIWKREGYTADYIAGAFGYTRQGLNKKIKRTKAALEQSGTTTTDEEEGGKHRHSTSPTDEETQ
jgi:IS30 family transposase